jgi:hypothetical protein
MSILRMSHHISRYSCQTQRKRRGLKNVNQRLLLSKKEEQEGFFIGLPIFSGDKKKKKSFSNSMI